VRARDGIARTLSKSSDAASGASESPTQALTESHRARMHNLRTVRALAACAVLLATACDRAPEVETAPSAAGGGDERLAALLEPCARPDPFTADTTDMLPVLVAKLATAESDVASRARADLVEAGRAALPELRRALQRSFSELGHAPRLLVLLELAAQAGGPEARAMGLEGLEHPSESVRSAAMRALETAGTPEDYERIALHTARGSEDLSQQGVRALVASDPARIGREFATWIDDGAMARLMDIAAPLAARHMEPAVRARILADERFSPVTKTWVLAASAAAGDEDARTVLRAALVDEVALQRQLALQAATGSRLVDEVRASAWNDPEPSLRILALQSIAAERDGPERRAELTAALADADESVRNFALGALCARGDEPAIEVALEMLAGTTDDIGHAMRALRSALVGSADLSRRVLARLEELQQGGARSAGRAIERAIGQVPLARAAEILVGLARTETGTIQDIPAHRWYLVQAGNTGAEGRAWIRAEWAKEPDAGRRLDYISAGVQEKSAAATAFLESVLVSPRASDLERLLAADLFARSVRAEQAAPILKRAVPRITDPKIQRALNCLLWRFYGPERPS